MNFNYRDFFIHNDDLHIIKEELSIVDEMGVSKENDLIPNAIPDWKRKQYYDFIKDAKEIYNLHKQGKNPDEIVNLINQNRKPHLQIKLDKVNLALKIVDIATKQMENKGHINAHEIERQINHTINLDTIIRLIKKLGIGKIRYYHKFTPEQDAFILFNYLQGLNLTETARKFNIKFSTESNKLNVHLTTISRNLINILKSDSESEISKYAEELLTKYYPTVDINNDNTKELLKNYIPSKTVGGKDRLARRGGKVDPTRQMSGEKGNLERYIHQTITTGQIPASGQLGKKYGAPINTQGALAL